MEQAGCDAESLDQLLASVRIARRLQEPQGEPAVVATLRRRAEADPSHALDLAGHLTALGAQLVGIGRNTLAVSYTDEALEMYERHGEQMLVETARCYNNLGVSLAATERLSPAVGASERACQLLRRAGSDVDEDLGRSLANLGRQYRTLGRADSALQANRQAVEVYERLVGEDVAAGGPLVDALIELVVSHNTTGDRERALARAEQAAALARARSQAGSDLALGRASYVWAVSLANARKPDAALAKAKEALAVYEAAGDREGAAALQSLINTLHAGDR
jgi:tetratricopeptide (TPR) repeat protein